jgi:hypothetical protein
MATFHTSWFSFGANDLNFICFFTFIFVLLMLACRVAKTRYFGQKPDKKGRLVNLDVYGSRIMGDLSPW